MCIITSSSLDRAASNVEETVPAVYRTTIASMKDTGLHLIKKLPTYNKYKCKAYRRRRKLAGVEKMAYNDMKEVEVPPDYNDFLLADYRDGNDRILIFALKEAREIVLNGKVFLCDGTFKNCLKPFYQLYVLFCDIGSTANENNVIPVIYALLPNKKQKTYLIMFELIKSQIRMSTNEKNWEWEPHKFITDFEQAAINAIERAFPQVLHHGCYFHFLDKIKRKATQLKILHKLKKNSNKNLNKIVSLCMVLPLLPESKIEEGLNYIIAESVIIGTTKEVNDLLKYITHFWMPKKAQWCSFGERHRTTNCCEAWNGQFNKRFMRKPTTTCQFLKVLKTDAAYHSVNALTTEPQNLRSKAVIDRNNYIQHVQMQLIQGDITVALFLEKLRR